MHKNSICARDNHINQSKIDPKPVIEDWAISVIDNRIWHCTCNHSTSVSLSRLALPLAASHGPSLGVRACVSVCSAAQRIVDRRYLPNMEACGSQLCVRERRRVRVLYLYVYIHYAFQVYTCNALP